MCTNRWISSTWLMDWNRTASLAGSHVNSKVVLPDSRSNAMLSHLPCPQGQPWFHDRPMQLSEQDAGLQRNGMQERSAWMQAELGDCNEANGNGCVERKMCWVWVREWEQAKEVREWRWWEGGVLVGGGSGGSQGSEAGEEATDAGVSMVERDLHDWWPNNVGGMILRILCAAL
ncbi:hypothetical protein BCR44DRAFT_1281546 [Catenaria anguillulae PL171]|uniref:Uncharacterized protein n=1 Tax=Catenaria anguillulae PL171 TaxID=765915 RepID=A0A1Y2HYF7_9FUNG|nr:hypothetical protein BCR44DRAFT_1281546 [Catenaria anguillulae PL171]